MTLSHEENEFYSNDVELFGLIGRYKIASSTGQTGTVLIDILDWSSKNAVKDFDSFTKYLMDMYGDVYQEKYVIISLDESDEVYTWIDTKDYKYVMCWQNFDGTITIRWIANTQ